MSASDENLTILDSGGRIGMPGAASPAAKTGGGWIPQGVEQYGSRSREKYPIAQNWLARGRGVAMKGKRHAWQDWPMSRLAAHAEANREDIDLLTAIRHEAEQRATPASDELCTRIDGLLAALGVFGEEEVSASPELAARLEAMAIELRDVRDALARAEARARDAEQRASSAEQLAQQLTAEAAHYKSTIHERVHLAPTAPDWMVDAAQRAFRMRFHPDRYSDSDTKEKAEAVFKEAESVFARLRNGYGAPGGNGH